MNRRTLAALAGALLLLTACVEDTGQDAEACAAPTVEIELALSADALDPSDPAVCRDQEVTLLISPEVDGVFHIHGYDEEVPATEVRSGEETELRFTAARSGQFPIELHPLDDPAGVEIGVFTVHEP
jgi:hypothetical protein